MYLRFKPYHRSNGSRMYRVQMFESYRCPLSGVPKSRMLAHIGSIPVDSCGWSNVDAYRFWEKLNATLARLPLTDGEKDSVRRSASRTVPQPNGSPFRRFHLREIRRGR